MGKHEKLISKCPTVEDVVLGSKYGQLSASRLDELGRLIHMGGQRQSSSYGPLRKFRKKELSIELVITRGSKKKKPRS